MPFGKALENGEGPVERKLVTVKVGTSSLTHADGSISPEKIEYIVAEIAALRDAGHTVILVTSGAVAAGFGRIGYAKRPTSIPAKQAAAAVGQGLLLEEYARFFAARGIVSAQILLTRDDFRDRRRYKNAFNALEIILQRGAVPIINENDTVSIDELRLGDNDTLSAQVAAMMHAGLLVLLTDMDGLYTADPRADETAKRIERVEHLTPENLALGGNAGTSNGTGGMATKLSAAKLATAAGVPVVICRTENAGALLRAAAGEPVGTYFAASETGMRTRQQWMAFYAQTRGNLYIDAGAEEALARHGKSLLPSGIVAAEGDFRAGDIVRVFRQGTNVLLGRGEVNFDKEELLRRMEAAEGHVKNAVAIHRDNWVEEV